MPDLRRICRKAAFSEPVQRRAVNCFLPPSGPGNSVYFAPCLIAAKPVKPCDRGVFGALNLLLISERENGDAAGFCSAQAQPEPSPNPARTQPEPIQKPAQSQLKASTALNRLSADRYSLLLRHEPGFALSGLRRGFRKTRFQSLFSAGPRTVFCRRPHPGNSVYFAPDLIAAKPVKPCDRGVFRALNLLLILKQANGKAGGGSAQPNPAQPKPEPKLVFCRPSHSLGSRHEPGLPCPACGASAAKPRFSGFAPR